MYVKDYTIAHRHDATHTRGDAIPLELPQQDTAVWANAFYSPIWQDSLPGD
ncbi:hypothetical protein [Lentisphaera araneosa]|uniref:hypothetical protein n=1 Tax=Lentisphaera araneosa TaxID=256847 RepID=UPI0012FCB64C|nr:hypothetical protein [Lentisphaera araneosa]